jgi:hypothetical protein
MKRGHLLLLAAVGSLVLATVGVDRTPTDSSKTNTAAMAPGCGQPADCPSGDPAQWAPLVAVDIGTIFARAPH